MPTALLFSNNSVPAPIADLLLDDEQLAKAHVEIESTARPIGQFEDDSSESII